MLRREPTFLPKTEVLMRRVATSLHTRFTVGGHFVGARFYTFCQKRRKQAALLEGSDHAGTHPFHWPAVRISHYSQVGIFPLPPGL